MKTAIVFATNAGSTARAAQLLADKLPGAQLFDISKRSAIKKCNIDDFDAVIVGSPIKMGEIDRNVVFFLGENSENLAHKKCGFFIMSFFAEHRDEYLSKLFPKRLSEHAVKGSFGAVIDLQKLKGVDRLMMKSVAKKNGALPECGIDEQAIGRFAAEFTGNQRW